ncbi:MAG: hypothetical protein ACOCVP_07200 [Wenzhouxiangella sp.]
MGLELEQAQEQSAIEHQAQGLHLGQKARLDRVSARQPADAVAANVAADPEIAFAPDAGPVQGIGLAQGDEIGCQLRRQSGLKRILAQPPSALAERVGRRVKRGGRLQQRERRRGWPGRGVDVQRGSLVGQARYLSTNRRG